MGGSDDHRHTPKRRASALTPLSGAHSSSSPLPAVQSAAGVGLIGLPTGCTCCLLEPCASSAIRPFLRDKPLLHSHLLCSHLLHSCLPCSPPFSHAWLAGHGPGRHDAGSSCLAPLVASLSVALRPCVLLVGASYSVLPSFPPTCRVEPTTLTMDLGGTMRYKVSYLSFLPSPMLCFLCCHAPPLPSRPPGRPWTWAAR